MALGKMRAKSKMAVSLGVLLAISVVVNTGLVWALGNGATIGGGEGNSAEGDFSTVSGGRNNSADGEFATVGGGIGNQAGEKYSSVGGGFLNEAAGSATVGGGVENRALGTESTVSGGFGNRARGSGSTVGGGASNVAVGEGSTIAGGGRNEASGNSSVVGGGFNNVAEGRGATVPGGFGNDAVGDNSFAAGHNANALHKGTFVWADDSTPNVAGTGVNSTGENQFLIRAAGGVGIGTNRPTQMLVVGDSFASSFPGNRVTVGNESGISGINLVEDNNQRAFMVWQDQDDYLELGTRSGGTTHGNTLVIRDDKVGVNVTNPRESLEVDGNVLASNFVRRSSERWKNDIQTIEGALEKVRSLRGVSYNWKADGKHHIGLIAEEVGQVVPEAVVYEGNGRNATGVDYAVLVPLLIEAIKEQQARIEALEARIAEAH